MIQLPHEPRVGDLARAETIAQIIRYLRAITPRPSSDILPQTGSGGTTYNLLARSRKSRLDSDALYPLKVVDASEGASPKVRVVFGVIKNIPADGMSAGDVPEFILTITTATKCIYGTVNISAGLPTSWTITSTTAIQPPADTAAIAYLGLATTSATIVDGVAKVTVAPTVDGSQGYQKCGAFHLFGLV